MSRFQVSTEVLVISFFLSFLAPFLLPCFLLSLYFFTFFSAFPRNFCFLVSLHRMSYASVLKELERVFYTHLYFCEIHVPEREPRIIHGFPLPSGKLSSSTVPTQYAWLGPCPLHQLPLHLSHHNVTTEGLRGLPQSLYTCIPFFVDSPSPIGTKVFFTTQPIYSLDLSSNGPP